MAAFLLLKQYCFLAARDFIKYFKCLNNIQTKLFLQELKSIAKSGFRFIGKIILASGKESACQCKGPQETWVGSLGREDPLE